MADRTEARLGWHILPKGGRLRNGDGREVLVGVPMGMKKRKSWDGKPIFPTLCRCGMHASPTIREAHGHLRLAPGGFLSLVLVQGKITSQLPGTLRQRPGSDRKFCGERRTVLAMWSYDRVRQVMREERKKIERKAAPTLIHIPEDDLFDRAQVRLLRAAGLDI